MFGSLKEIVDKHAQNHIEEETDVTIIEVIHCSTSVSLSASGMKAKVYIINDPEHDDYTLYKPIEKKSNGEDVVDSTPET